MRIRPKLVLTFSAIFILAFSSSSYAAHITIQSSLLDSGISEEQSTSILEEIGTSIGIVSAIIGIIAVCVVFWVSARIANPISTLSEKLKSQEIGKKLRNIEIKRESIDKDDEINEVIYTINSMINRLNDLEEKKDVFLSMVTHELKTPASTIVGFSKVLLNSKMAGELNPEQKKSIETMKRNATRLEDLIGDLLDSRKLGLSKMKFAYANVDITKLVEYILHNNKNITDEKNIEFVNSTKETIFATTDESRLEQVYNNLIRNAVDFVPKEGGKIEIGVKGDDNKIICYVKDNGIGISKEKQKELFNQFYQVDSSLQRKHGGTGLGLYISKGIIEALGGKIWVESELGKGASIYFSIPKIKEERSNNENIGN
ncbi:MAG: HAMP domain-containing histidine kinase [Nitrosopumilus sp.]|nr:HAMP domain-containing histidine kinase [Nitrosopumilus sp.]MDH3793456.1 HAMP domain-containing histidine kinase [Nitrosopumilus sp.]MDH3854502.1 HAMP domain-containing histidine kinase [Nitrosopumilus sp.]